MDKRHRTIGLGIGIAAIVAWGLFMAISSMVEDSRRSKEAWDDSLAAQAECRRQQDDQRAEIGKILVRAGVWSHASVEAAIRIEDKLKCEGYDEKYIRMVLPIAVDEAGKRGFSDKELRRLTAAAEFQPEVFAIDDSAPEEDGK